MFRRRGASGRCACGLAVESRHGNAYNEEAFRYLLGIQRKRAERSERPFLLVLVDLHEEMPFAPGLSRALFAGLWRSLRDADLIGWYREERIAGIVLTELGDGPQDDVAALVVQRITLTLSECLPPGSSRRLQVRVCHIQPTVAAMSSERRTSHGPAQSTAVQPGPDHART